MKVLKFLIFLVVASMGLVSIPLTDSNPLLVMIYILSAQMLTLIVLRKISPTFLASPLTGSKILLLVIYPGLVRLLSSYPTVQIIFIGIYLAIFSPFEVKKL